MSEYVTRRVLVAPGPFEMKLKIRARTPLARGAPWKTTHSSAGEQRKWNIETEPNDIPFESHLGVNTVRSTRDMCLGALPPARQGLTVDFVRSIVSPGYFTVSSPLLPLLFSSAPPAGFGPFFLVLFAGRGGRDIAPCGPSHGVVSGPDVVEDAALPPDVRKFRGNEQKAICGAASLVNNRKIKGGPSIRGVLRLRSSRF